MADQWLIQDGSKSKPSTEQSLRRKLRAQDLSGLELVRPPGASQWLPLHEHPIFAEEVPHTGDAAEVARLRGDGRASGAHTGTQWMVQDGNRSRTLSERTLRRKLRTQSLSGTELVRPPGASQWLPLHEHPIFAEEVPHTGDAAGTARRRELTGFLSHLGVFVAVMAFLGFPWWGIFWGLGLLGHAAQVFEVLRTRRAAVPLPAAPAQPALPEGVDETDPFEARLEGLLGPLQADGEAEGIRTEARALHRRALALAAAIAETDLVALSAELAERRQAAAAATREADQEIFLREVAALEARLEAAQGLEAAHARLAAQERELLHRLEGIRLLRLQAAAEGEGGSGAAEIAVQLQEARQRLQAAAEVEDRLAAARRAAQPQRHHP